jgi:beta-1,4-N-acetylglucosaminyltransferase
MKICLVTSSGGHLMHLLQLKKWWIANDRFWVTFDKEDAKSALEGEKVYNCYYPTNRNIINLLRNTLLSIRLLFLEKPNIIISTGAGVAIPFFYIGKLLGSKLIYIEVYDRISLPSLTGKIVYPITDRFIIQWEEQRKFYPKGIYLGGIF